MTELTYVLKPAMKLEVHIKKTFFFVLKTYYCLRKSLKSKGHSFSGLLFVFLFQGIGVERMLSLSIPFLMFC